MKAGRSRLLAAGMLLGLIPCVTTATAAPTNQLFEPATRCIACHNGLVTAHGEDASMGHAWRPTMMANSARDPYWQAAVRREVTEHPSHGRAIEDECSKCHMPMATTAAHAAGHEGEVFKHFRVDDGSTLALDGVSCSLCHQITEKFLGQRRSLVGGFDIDLRTEPGQHKEYGPYVVDSGRAQLMRSASHLRPVQGTHLSSSEVCATCHTLYTHALDANDRVIGELPEQVPYQEWLHSEYRTTRTCQSCHMPAMVGPLAISSVAGPSRPRLHRHDFVGGNFLAQAIFSGFGAELSVEATPTAFNLAASRTRDHLGHDAASVAFEGLEHVDGKLRTSVAVTNRTGHKLPTAYPSRRVWLHFTVRSLRGAVLFESGALSDNGSIAGNENDIDASKFEPHYRKIERASEVAIYESIMGRFDGRVTTGLLSATHYLKDNRLLPVGFDKATASLDVAVHGEATRDPDFQGGRDTVTYVIPLGNAEGPFEVEVEVLYQPVGFRWAQNLRQFSALEPQRFVRYYTAMARHSAAVLAKAHASVR